jgi:signal peptidase II
LKPFYKYLLLAFGLVGIDQVVKMLVKLNMAEHESIPVFGSFFQIYFIENKGAAFGLTISKLLAPIVTISEDTGKIILTVFSLILVGFIFNYLRAVARQKGMLPVLVAMILGGALGNIIDRVFYGAWFAGINSYEGGLLHGRVVDMFFFDLWNFRWPAWVPGWGGGFTSTPIFNFADACISVGIVAILIFQKRLFAKPAVIITASAPLEAEQQPDASDLEVETVLKVEPAPEPPTVEEPTTPIAPIT